MLELTLDKAWGGAAMRQPRSGIGPIPFPKKLTAKEKHMLIGQSLFIPGSGTPGVRYYGPWMPRQGDAFTAAIQVLGPSSTGWSLVWEV